MGDRTKISWTDATWSPVTGCTKVSLGCDLVRMEVVARNERSNPSPNIIFQECFSTAASTLNGDVRFTRKLFCFPMWQPMAYTMMEYRRFNSQVFRAIIHLVAVEMMQLFTLAKWTTKLLHSHQVMLVGIAVGLPQRMAWRHPHKHISMGTDRAPSFPIRIPCAATSLITARAAGKRCRLLEASTFWAWSFLIHSAFSITHGLLPVKKGGDSNAQ